MYYLYMPVAQVRTFVALDCKILEFNLEFLKRAESSKPINIYIYLSITNSFGIAARFLLSELKFTPPGI